VYFLVVVSLVASTSAITAPLIRCFYALTLCALQIVFTITITNQLPGKTRPRNDLLYVECNVNLCSSAHFLAAHFVPDFFRASSENAIYTFIHHEGRTNKRMRQTDRQINTTSKHTS